MARKLKTMDGNNAAAHVAYAFTDVAAIYPITPSSTMAEYVDKWSANGQKNIFGQPVKVLEMQSEAGAAGAVHGSIMSGALTSTFTASQGLLLMIPNMYKWAGEQMPAVIHVSARTVATHALSIFGDQGDVMACRQTGFAMLASSSPQEAMDLGAVAHLSAIRGSMPFMHFFDGFRTSHEMQKIEVWDYNDLAEMLDYDALNTFRRRANNPNHPVLRGSAQNGDIFFQAREAINGKYAALPDVVEGYMNTINKKLGTDYKLFNYYGAPDAKHVIVAMGSVCETAEEVVDYLNASGQKTGLVKVRLYRPFSVQHFLNTLPPTVETIGILDRTKEPGSVGEPLYLDVYSALCGKGITVVGGRYGLASKDTTPGAVIAAFRNIQGKNPKTNFTIGIEDDVTRLSLPITEEPDTTPKDIISCKFWGLGSDGTVGANKNSIKIIGDHTDLKAQAYFQYDSRKSGGVTISHLRFGKSPIKSTYYVSKANFVACHNPSYLEIFDMVQDVKPGGVFLANCAWDVEELGKRLPAGAKKYLADNNIRFYTCDAEKIARELGLGNKTNAILQAAFFKLSDILPLDDAVKYMKDAVRTTYGRKGEDIVNMNVKAIDAGLESLVKIDIPASWKTPAADKPAPAIETDRPDVAKYVCGVMETMNSMRGDKLPVSAFLDTESGSFVPAGTAAFEKRKIAIDVPTWIPENCIQCNQCSYVCPHSVIRAFALDPEEAANAPEGMKMVPMTGKGNEQRKFAITPSVFDCTGCGSCANVCPAKNKALVMKPLDEQADQQKYFDYADKHVSRNKDTGFAPASLKGSQFKKPLLEYPGACAGCGETPYARLVTQLFGDRMFIANATGCSSIWAGSAPTTPYTVGPDGKGPAWSNSLFEDNAEFGLGMATASVQRREGVRLAARELTDKVGDAAVKTAIENWLAAFNDGDASKAAGKALEDALESALKKPGDFPFKTQLQALYDLRDQFVKPSVWIFGGDGWAYDIGYGGLDHVIASGENVNILVFDTEVYSNTGGQASKSTPTGAVAQFAAAGKSVKKKDLAQIAMSYGYVYVAQVSMGASQQQTLKAILEAESYDGPSLVIAYAPCINHGIRAGMGKSQTEMKKAVDSGYWNLLRFDPRLAAEGKNPLSIDSKAPTESYNDFIMGEVRYSSLKLEFPERAEVLFSTAEKEAQARYNSLVKQKEMYDAK
ncbi:pyruvate-ferredoxin/flavodoxin oxidoreductase [Sporobacter termitidis DSM 10068]|uniref:Pyruvate:ferredoxin oxidoreductase n=1 Tax=Sporobacter termitidis DSM 10068 TaxID=1123282 RepID=A0A1M5VMG4_9FIRM|nr:pyruvate:ferredoxin (flavodoxin) oxidoreductase [Sporobacter termitidis]SHH76442.1 pyruvate-ferredoxin/flavodoxin oxidoreductase [Sporobacter termitidis DSM 10068]